MTQPFAIWDGSSWDESLQPAQFTHIPPTTVRTISGRPVRLGYAGLKVIFPVLNYDEMATLMSYWGADEPNFNPDVRIRYLDNQTTNYVIVDCVMHKPQIGNRLHTFYQNVTVVFDHFHNYSVFT